MGTFINACKPLIRLRYVSISVKGGCFYNFQLQMKSGKNARFLTENKLHAHGRILTVTIWHLVSYSMILWHKEL